MSDSYVLPFQRDLLDTVGMALDEVQEGSTSQGILLIGESGTGKTMALDMLCAHVEAMFNTSVSASPYQQLTAVCRVESGAKADAVSILKEILSKLGKPYRAGTRATLAQLETDAMAALSARKVRLLVLEEFHNTLLAGSRQLRGQAALLLKNIWNRVPQGSSASWVRPGSSEDTRLVLVVSGTEELLPVFEKDAELSSRFNTMLPAPRIRLYPAADFQLFRQVARNMCRRYDIEALLDVAKDDALAVRLYFASEGHLRVLNSLLLRCRTLRKREQHKGAGAIEILANAHSKTLPKGISEDSNPFLWSGPDLNRRAVERIDALKRKMGS